MTAYVVLSCERQVSEGMCAEQTRVFGVTDVDAARRVAADVGWHHSGAGDRCPRCSGRAYACPPIIDAQHAGSPR